MSSSPSPATSVGTSVSTSTSVTDSTTVQTPISSVDSTDMIAKLFETQSQLIAAQMQVVPLPPLTSFEGRGDGDEVEFEQWIERFEERARLAKWTEETKLCQLRLHLSKIAKQAFQLLPKENKSDYKQAVAALKSRFR